MTWIETIGYDEADGKLRKLYDRLRGPSGQIDRILTAHGLRPHSLEGHLGLYKAVLHHAANQVPAWFLEALGVYVSLLNHCDYCVAHHSAGLRRMLEDNPRHEAIMAALEKEQPENAFEGWQAAAMAYAHLLTRDPARVSRADIDRLRAAGLDDGRILEINQVIAYFAYANRTVLGLGTDPKGELLGLAPNNRDDPNNWRHA